MRLKTVLTIFFGKLKLEIIMILYLELKHLVLSHIADSGCWSRSGLWWIGKEMWILCEAS